MRLIDADTLIKDLSYLYTKNHSPVDMKAKEILTTVMEQSTVYDVDKVVEKLESEKKVISCVDNEFQRGAKNGHNCALNMAIEIVKGGCVEERTDNI